MKYVIRDLQYKELYLSDGQEFDTLEQAKAELIAYHRDDWNEEEDGEINDMSLDDLLTVFQWKLEEVS